MTEHDPGSQITAGNPWYLADQFRAQLGTSGRRRVVEDRWRVFGDMLDGWLDTHRTLPLLTVLDAGCGDGINLVGLRRVADERSLRLRLLGVDYNPLRLSRARQVSPDARLQRASLYQLPLADCSVDVVLCNHVLEHLPELDAATRELARVLKPGGLLVVGVPNEGCASARLRNGVIQPAIGRTTDHVHFFTDSALREALRRAGFSVTSLVRETFFFPCSYVNMGCNEFAAGHWLMSVLRRLFPSQAGGLIASCEKPGVQIGGE